MHQWYANIAVSHWILFGALWVLCILYLLAGLAKAFINDEKYGPPHKIFADQYRSTNYNTWLPKEKWQWGEGSVLTLLLGGPLAGFILGVGWIIFWPAALVIGGLFFARTLTRAKKAYLAHTHDADGRVK